MENGNVFVSQAISVYDLIDLLENKPYSQCFDVLVAVERYNNCLEESPELETLMMTNVCNALKKAGVDSKKIMDYFGGDEYAE